MIFFKVLTKKYVKDNASQFQNLRVNFHKSHAPFSTRLSQLGYAITSFAQDGFRKCSLVRTKCALALTFLEQYHKGGDEFLNHIVQVTDDETWVSFVNVQTKEQSKQ
jgi:hypothetical protein